MKINILKSVISILFLFALSFNSYAQIDTIGGGGEGGGGIGIGSGSASISGNLSPAANSTHTYDGSVSFGTFVYSAYWNVTGGVIESQNSTSVTIRWTTTGFQTLQYVVTSSSSGGMQTTAFVNVTASAPAIPSIPSVTNNCGSTVLTRGTPPSGVAWYWQSSSSGTSTANSATSITRTSGSVYYLRALSITGLWSLPRAVNYTINTAPNTPSAPTVTNNCGSTVLTKGSSPSGITWYWQSSASGTSTSNSAASITRTSGSVYYLRARNNSSGCWGSARTVSYSVNAVPGTPSTPSVTNNCGSTVLTKGSSPSGITWYWQSSISGTSTANSASSITRTSGSVYYLRARNNSSGCWGSTRSVTYLIDSGPATPSVPSVTNNCGSTVLTKGGSPSGITWYWQSSASGTSTSNSATSITRTSGSVYYLRARNNSSGCWSSARTVSYSINAVPSVPTTPSVANNCGSTVLTKGSSPSGITWYWQSSASGTSTANSAASITRTSGTVYYLRARNNSSGCWGSARTVNYSINAVPSTPSTPSVANNCGSTVLTKGSAPSGITWYWQSSSSGTSTSNSASSITRTSGTVYYLRARNNSSGCWGSARTVSYSINAGPATPSAPTIANNCDSTVLTKGSSPSGITWYWQSSASGTSTSNSASSITRTSGTVYYLRARNNSSGCWGTARTINYTITQSTIWYADTDGDGFGNAAVTSSACSQPAGYVANSSDFNDTTSNITNIAPQTFYQDTDGDGFGDPAVSVLYSVQPTGYVTNNTDQCLNTYGTNNGCPIPLVSNLSNENYVHTIIPQIAVDDVSQISRAEDVVENVTYHDGLGRVNQSIGIRAGADKLKNNLINWENSWTIGSGSAPFFGQNGATSENKRINGVNPYGHSSILWECGNDPESNADGGWNTPYFTIDNTVGYQYTTWVKRTGSQDGNTYHGTRNVNNLNGTPNTNPYFWAGDLPQLDQWYLLVGVIHPHDYTGEYSGISGVYDTNGNKVISGTDFKWANTTTNTYFRNYLYYATDTNVRQYFYDPIVQKRDGNQASIDDLVAGHTGKDIVTHTAYDSYGRQTKEYLPYAPTQTGSNGLYRTDALAQTNSYYNTNYAADLNISAPNPYSETQFETSPLNRPLKQAAPGEDWKLGNNNEIIFEYQSNATNEVRQYEVTVSFANNTYTPTLIDNGHYTAGELYKAVTKDENWTSGNNHTTEEFKDKQGRVVLKRTYNANTSHDTYYVYDDFGNLTYVLPPKMDATTALLSSINNTLDQLGYQYIYDHRNRLVEKKIPGKGWEYIVYNKLDQPILTQDANLRANNQWLFTKYDAFGRVAYTGIKNTSSGRTVLQTAANDPSITSQFEDRITDLAAPITVAGIKIYYTNIAFPGTLDELLTVNYYDNYIFSTIGFTEPTNVYGQSVTTNVKGLATGTKVRVLGTNDWITTLTYYDAKGRPIYIASNNEYLNTTDIVESKLDFAGKVLETKSMHTKTGNAPIITIDNFSYDHATRLVKQTQTLNGQTEVIVENVYDEIGQMVSKSVGGNTSQARLQNVDYTYNVRGWLKAINDVNSIGNDLFSFNINYNDPTSGTALYNGNISQTHWKTANTDNSLKTYTYDYDDLNRIISGTDNTGNYNLSNLSYDKNGNLLTLNRAGHTNSTATIFGSNMDILTYAYDGVGNRLKSVNDSGHETLGFTELANTSTEYTYDANGNMLTDANKGITGINYNHLNLPTSVTINGSAGNGTINYIYDATGVKLQKSVDGTTTDYAGSFVYENSSLKFFNHPEGYIEPDGTGGYTYVYQYKDHLGNIRLSYADDDGNGQISTSAEIREENNYYPFGLKHKGYNNQINGVDHLYGFGGQEESEELGKNTIDYQWRDYDPALGRFNKIDRFAEKYENYTPYHFSKNSPLFYREIAGDSISVASVTIADKTNGTNHSQTITNDLQTFTGLTINTDAKTGILSYAKDVNGNPIVSTTTDANGVITQNGSATARTDLINAIDANGIINVGISADRSATSASTNRIFLGENQINDFITGTPSELNNNTMGYGAVLLHEIRHTNIGGGTPDGVAPTDLSSTGPVVDRVNIYRNELDNNPSRGSASPYGQRTHYNAVPFSSGASINFRFRTTNKKGRSVRRSRKIKF